MASIADAKALVQKLMRAKDAIEAEVDVVTTRLKTGPNPPGLSGNLVDKEGFPRGDIDLTAVRLDRQRLACLTNDHKDVMKQIDQALVALHSAAKSQGGVGFHAPAELAPPPTRMSNLASSTARPATEPAPQPPNQSPSGNVDMETEAAVTLVPFAFVDDVADGSPAAAAGIQLGDLMCSFGGVQHGPEVQTARGNGAPLLPAVARVLAANEGKPVQTVLLRRGAQVTLELTPQQWGGRGLLGCHLLPL